MNGPPIAKANPKMSLGDYMRAGIDDCLHDDGKSVKKPVQRPEGIKISSPITSKAIVTASEGRLAGSGIGALPQLGLQSVAVEQIVGVERNDLALAA